MDHHPHRPLHHQQTTNTGRAEAERLLGIAEKLLQTRDLTGSREFALLAQETEPLLEGSDQILAITDVLLASEKRVINNRHHDWYSILQTPPRSSDSDLLKKNYRRLALLLHPDKNPFHLADSAFKLVADAWALLSDPNKRAPYDHDLALYSKVDLRHDPPPPQSQRQPQPQPQQQEKDKLPVRRSSRPGVDARPPPKAASFWTACPYCYVLYEYPRVYEECCLRCQNCQRAFHAAVIPSLPPVVPGKEAYYCCWGFFPLGFSLSKAKENNRHRDGNATDNNGHNNNNNVNNNNNNNPNSGFPNWMPGMFGQGQGNVPNVNVSVSAGVDLGDGSDSGGFANNNTAAGGGFMYSSPPGMRTPGAKKRGRPRKNPVHI